MQQITHIFESGIVDNRDIILKLYSTLEEVTKAFYGYDIDDEVTLEGFTDTYDNEVDVDPEEITRNITGRGCWGFVDKAGVIHAWIDFKTVKPLTLIQFFSHELGHTQKPDYKDFVREEKKAETYSDVSSFAYTLTQRLL